MSRRALAAVALLLCCAAGNALADKRVALVVGNGSYKNIPHLDNARGDAGLIAQVLKERGFTLVGDGVQTDLDKAHFDNAVRSFGDALAGAQVGVFYYAGHGLQMGGVNYLVPVDANPTKPADADYELVDANRVLRQMQDAGTDLNVVLLDACRNNPFGGRGLRGADGGLAQMDAPKGTLISFATSPGSVAQDGDPGAHGPYAQAVSEALAKPGLDVLQVFNVVGLLVSKRTGGSQQPWMSNSPIEGEFHFTPPLPGPVPVTAPAATKTAAPEQAAELMYWDSVKTSSNPAELQDYLDKFPNGTFAALARTRIAALRQQAQPAAPAAGLDAGVKAGNDALQRKDYGGAMRAFREAAGRGDASAMYDVGALYAHGMGVPLDYAQAMQWFMQAADHGNVSAMQSIGAMYEQGWGVTRDYGQAMSWLRKAADQGDVTSMEAVGGLYASGQGVAQDYVEAMRWFRKAADQGDASAMGNVGALYARGWGTAQDYAEAMRWFRKGAELGDPPSTSYVGELYSRGWGVAQDDAEAVRWFRKAAEAGDASSMFALGQAYEKGRGVAPDLAGARRWYQSAADHGNADAAQRLALLQAHRAATGSAAPAAPAPATAPPARAVGQSPPQLLLQRAAALEKQGDYQGAGKAYGAAGDALAAAGDQNGAARAQEKSAQMYEKQADLLLQGRH